MHILRRSIKWLQRGAKESLDLDKCDACLSAKEEQQSHFKNACIQSLIYEARNKGTEARNAQIGPC